LAWGSDYGSGAGVLGGHEQGIKPADPNFIKAKAIIEAGNFAGATPLLHQVVAAQVRTQAEELKVAAPGLSAGL
jgi:hypothetical protein